MITPYMCILSIPCHDQDCSEKVGEIVVVSDFALIRIINRQYLDGTEKLKKHTKNE